MDERRKILQEIIQDIKAHTCSLRSGCKQAVPGEGNPASPIVFIGEGPGRWEDEQGRPFVGPAGKLLNELLVEIGWKREDVYITNINRCRPPGNRDPLPEEVAEHSEFLRRELELIKPKLIVLLGRHALNKFLPNEQISKCHGRAKRKGREVYLAIYHPAAALHNPNLMGALREDFKKIPLILSKIDELPPAAAGPTSAEVMPPAQQDPLF
ncbi:hypothetical protein A2V68_00580 [candidate division Kazan bacterium RBG_13_50_9]|uniref:Type-4 uracil-DNA glycosylase n=1 Tax=candidate division Kazan bacterium RBG_13_50_9 TaxID=1798535 RepID=A0A1F4NS57_UNCK3|nr:MAG: hypothetical protein A2V68_00580 [candidate division Kazan bacterium RBG_13_50_9]